MEDIEQAVEDEVNVFKGVCRDSQLVPGIGAVETELSCQVSAYTETCLGLDHYVIKKFATSLEAIPRLLVDNLGVKSSEEITKLLEQKKLRLQHGDEEGGIGDTLSEKSSYAVQALSISSSLIHPRTIIAQV